MAAIEQINYIKSPATVIYQALSTEEGLGKIWTPKLEVKPEVGFVNTFDFNEGYITKMKVTALHHNKKVAWECIDSDPEWIGTTISFELSDSGGKTAVLLRHAGWEKVTEFYRWCNYNWALFLLRLKEYCEQKSSAS